MPAWMISGLTHTLIFAVPTSTVSNSGSSGVADLDVVDLGARQHQRDELHVEPRVDALVDLRLEAALEHEARRGIDHHLGLADLGQHRVGDLRVVREQHRDAGADERLHGTALRAASRRA